MFINVFVLSTFLLALVSQVLAHAAVAPMLGVAGTPKRSDVKRVSTANVCGAGVNIGNLINTSTVVTAAANGAFQVTGISYNVGGDGSRSFSAQVSANGRGTSLVRATVTKNGQATPQAAGSQQITAQLPAGTKCTGGRAGNRCVVQFRSTAGFGNCVVVQQAEAARQGGTRTARALLAEMEQRRGGAVDVVKRWIWA